jgi:hypothetical protein
MPTATAPPSRAFRVEDVPASGADLIRWPIGVHPSGRTGEPGTVLSGIAWNLMLTRQQDAPLPEPPEVVEIELKKVVRTEDGYKLVERPNVQAIPTRRNDRPGRFTSLDVSGADLLASFLLGEEAYGNAPDRLVWEALLAACQQTGASGHALRKINDAVTLTILARAGVIVQANQVRWE